jgi:OmpA-OmpF porin, OOP family
MKRLSLIFSILLVAAAVRGQFVYDYLKAADEYFNKKDYASAAEYYEKW